MFPSLAAALDMGDRDWGTVSPRGVEGSSVGEKETECGRLGRLTARGLATAWSSSGVGSAVALNGMEEAAMSALAGPSPPSWCMGLSKSAGARPMLPALARRRLLGTSRGLSSTSLALSRDEPWGV